MKNKEIIFVFLLVLLFCVSCRMMENLAGNESAGSVESLWPDVPELEGATKNDLAIPLATRLIIRTFMHGKLNYIAYQTTRSARDVQDFYSKERMHESGWTALEEGCVGDSEGITNQGAVCFFIRMEKGKEEGLAIVAAEDPQKKQTDIFYARIDLSEIPEDSKTFNLE